MHELSITQSVVDAVLEHTAGRQVTEVRLRVGRLSGVVPDAMRFCFDLATAGTPLEGATLEIDEVGGRAHCRDCDAEFELDDPILLCPCGSADVQVIEGRSLKVASVEVGSRV
ncbi:MAG: hydrogenase maturation nickel metallochaperone HypA [Nocardioidaceae bacterium]